MRCASAFRCPWLVIGSDPPVDSITISDQNTPVEMCTDATFEIGILSSLLPNSRDFVRITLCGLTTSFVGKKKFPCVQRLALNVSAGEESIAFTDALAASSAISRLAPVRAQSHPSPSFRTHLPTAPTTSATPTHNISWPLRDSPDSRAIARDSDKATDKTPAPRHFSPGLRGPALPDSSAASLRPSSDGAPRNAPRRRPRSRYGSLPTPA